ncbi:MAG TPA: hypothetical protein VFW47_09690 [Phenylobacterium sp.]|nr:hypothetical protein [Phenylobacterium sp.]
MGVVDLIVGLAAVASGLASLVRRGAPFTPPWRLWLAIWGHAASASACTTLAVFDPANMVETPLILVAAFSLGELALAILDLRGWAGRRTPDWLA